MSQVPATSYSTIFHCNSGGFVCLLRLLQGLVSLAMFWIFWKGFQAISKERNNRLSVQDKWLYQLAMSQTALLTIYYLIFQQFFMLSTIRNFMIWISVNVLQIQCLMLYGAYKNNKNIIQWTAIALQGINLCMWFFFSLGDGSSLENSDFNLGYNCKLMDWMIMSGILLLINTCSACVCYLKVQHLDFQIAHYDQQRQIRSAKDQRLNIILISISGLTGSLIMFIWDFLAFNKTNNNSTCEQYFLGNTIFRNILCFLLKIICMQFNPSAIYYAFYYSRKQDFSQQDTVIKPLIGSPGRDYFDDGASDMNRTVSGFARQSNYSTNPAPNQRNVSQYN